MAETIDPYQDRSGDVSWLDATKDDGTPLDEVDVPILDEPPFVTKVRAMEDKEGIVYYILPDGGCQVPTDFFAAIDEGAVSRATDVANNLPPEEVTPSGKATIPSEQRALLEKSGGPAAQKLLNALELGASEPIPGFEQAVEGRLRKAGLL